jgi:DNA modification methylase
MEGMAQFPDGYFDLAIVDPPYGVGSITYMPHKRTKAVGGYLDEYNIVMASLDAAKSSSVVKKHLPEVHQGYGPCWNAFRMWQRPAAMRARML